MDLDVQESDLKGVFIIRPPTHFEDFRGEYVEIYNQTLFHKAGIEDKFIQDDISVSSRHVLRGIHGDAKT
ncbi:MAG: dTDP-4-dehydrorhamnose 3,5-epimerase family protein, partial [Pseudomonadota bacterium]|nr:dTDP-4-dehydrorhamnose 3,5-epimerase family protein [Pseudomonadota bacterium]